MAWAVPGFAVADQPLPGASQQALQQVAVAAAPVPGSALHASPLPASAVSASVVGHALTGKVTTQATPLAAARVYAYEMNDLSLRRVDTDGVGTFLFEELPAGLYKIITVKPGFIPAVVLLQRRTAQTSQYLEVDLAPQELATASGEESFWSLRRKIPTDVLREIETLEQLPPGDPQDGSLELAEGFALEETRFQAMTGLDDAVPGSGQMNRGTLGMRGTVGATEFDLTGDHWIARGDPEGEASHSNLLSLSVSRPEGATVSVVTSDNKLEQSGEISSVDLERYQVTWSQQIGPGASEVSAEVVDESNFFSSGPLQPAGLPAGSRTLNLEGSYEGATIGANSLTAGFRYRQVQGTEDDIASLVPTQRVDLFGSGIMPLSPKIFVQYGLYSTLRDGSLSLVPQGGVVVDLGSDWTASTLASHKVHEDDPVAFDFVPMQYASTGSGCEGERYCYQLQVSRALKNQGELRIGATHRRFDETLRLYFSDDFFSHLESLYLVEGDRLPEVQVSLTRRIAPRIMARLESSVAAGGGGVFYATDEIAYEHNVRYMVTSLDTRFEQTSTGVFLAFHHLEQQFVPTSSYQVGTEGTDLGMQRLQLMLTQDLSALNIASLALRLNMEVSRGGEAMLGSPSDEELRKRVMGGVAVSF
jgi:hypothetical protein